jgi:hypothetical protein
MIHSAPSSPPSPSTSRCLVDRIMTGGQTGADRAGLDWAIEHGIPSGGYCPQGRLAEDGVIAARYPLTETESAAPEHRTERNVIESEGTVLFASTAELSGGSLHTADCAQKHGRPFLHILAGAPAALAAQALRDFVEEHDIRVLNVAGSRQSKEPDLGAFVREILSRALLRAESAD